MKDRETKRHPAFGVIQICRTSGTTRLFKSDFTHQNYITIRVHTAEEIEGYGVETDAFPREEIIEVAMSEAQFARLMTTPNMGCGTPCTIEGVRMPPSLEQYKGQRIPPIEKTDIQETHRDKVEQICKERLAEFDEIQQRLQQWRTDKHRPTLAELDALIRQLQAMHLSSNFGFLQQVLEEHMERTVEEGRTEIEAHLMRVVQQLGLSTAQGQEFPKLDNPSQKVIEAKDTEDTSQPEQ